MRLLISLCNANQYNSQFSLAVIDTASDERWLVDCTAFIDPKTDGGITGLCQTPHGLALAVQSAHPRIVLLDRDFKVVWTATDERLGDVHSLALHDDGRILVASSARNKILDIDPATGAMGVFWEYAPLETPHLHINSLAFHQGRAVACSHSLPAECGEAADGGGCWRLDDFELIISGLRLPHTLTAHDDALVCLSSADSRVVTWRDGEISAVDVPGYLRGLRISDGEAFIGSSALRFVSRKAKGIKHYADFTKVVGNPAYMSSLVICDSGFTERRRIATTFLGFEIYDVIEDPGAPEAWLASPAPAIRMQTMQRLMLTLRDQLDGVLQRAARAARQAEEA